MIVVGGFNSAIDKLAETDRIEPGTVMRLRNVRGVPGGKGLHVALACSTLGERATLVGVIDQGSRALFESLLGAAGVTFDGVSVDEPIRTCLAVRDAEGRMTEFLEPGPRVSERVATTLVDRFQDDARDADVAVLSGSLPTGFGVDTYGRLILAAGPDRIVLDTSGEALAAAIGAAPLVVKPNRDEAARIVGFEIGSWETARRAAALIGSRGPRMVIVSLGADGAVVWTAGQTFRVQTPVLDARNVVGAGDCLTAGFATGLVRGWSIEECARYAVACGAAKVLHPDTGVLRRDDVERLAPAVEVTRLESASIR